MYNEVAQVRETFIRETKNPESHDFTLVHLFTSLVFLAQKLHTSSCTPSPISSGLYLLFMRDI